MALILGSSLAKGSIFELQDYEAAFHPWWDSLQDYVMYSAIIVGELLILLFVIVKNR